MKKKKEYWETESGWEILHSWHFYVAVEFGKGLDNMNSEELVNVKLLLEESHFHSLSFHDRSARIQCKGKAKTEMELSIAESRGFVAKVVKESSYDFVRRVNGKEVSAMLIETDDDAERLMRRMVKAGVLITEEPE